MVCTSVTLPGGQRAIVCGPRGPVRKCACGARAQLQCDWKVDGGTCDAWIYEACTTMPAAGKDICPTHKPALQAWLAAR
jgi:hypothetical protein